MEKRNIKPIYIMNQEGLPALEKRAVFDGVLELTSLAGVNLDIKDFGVLRNEGYRNSDGSLNRFQSVDWYIQRGREDSRNQTQLNGGAISNALIVAPWGIPPKGESHYDILIVNSDLYAGDSNFSVGLAGKGLGTIVSTFKIQGLDDTTRYECVKTEIMHELGHVFGLVPEERTENVEDSLGKHCMNRCIMRQGLSVPSDWINMTNDRLQFGALCSTCETDLKDYFE